MKLLFALTFALSELGIGTAFFFSLQRGGEIRKSFFIFGAWLAGSCFLLILLTVLKNEVAAYFAFLAMIFAILSAVQFRAERPRLAKIMLGVSGLIAIFSLQNQIQKVGMGVIPPLLTC